MRNYVLSQTLSVCVRLRPSEGKDDTLGIAVLQVVIGRKVDRIPLKILWPLNKFDESKGVLLPRFKGDQQCSDYNLELGQALSRANEICVDIRLNRTSITPREFKYRFQNYVTRERFDAYMKRKAEQLCKEGEIKASTCKLHTTNANRWNRFAEVKKEDINFSNLSRALIMRFRNWLRDDELLEHNTITGALKVTKNYLRRGAKDNFRFDPEAMDIPTTFRRGRKVGLSKEEVRVLKEEYKNPSLTDLERECLRKFLFMTYTGLRISDANRVTSRHINDGKLDILQFKTQDTGKRVLISLTPFALELIKGKKGLLFQPMLDQLFNKTIKRVAERAGIEKKVSAHVARFTFARWLYTKSGNIKAVSDLLGHGSIRTTEIYLQLDDEERGNCLKFLEEL